MGENPADGLAQPLRNRNCNKKLCSLITKVNWVGNGLEMKRHLTVYREDEPHGKPGSGREEHKCICAHSGYRAQKAALAVVFP